jgi:hypothetical protein
MEKVNYRLALQAAQTEMQDALQERSALDVKIATLKQTIEGLSALLQDKPAEPAELPEELFGETGISGAIRFLLMRSEVPLTPVQIRHKLTEHAFDLSDYANAMAVIHNTLKRLDKQGELMTVKDASGQTIAYTTRLIAEDFGPRRPRHEVGDVTGPTSAHDSGMRGDEKPKPKPKK